MITNLIASILIRVLIVRIIYTKFLNKNLFVRRIIICGAGKAGKLMAQKLLFEDSYGIEVIGFLDDSVIIGEEVFQNLKVLGSAKDLSKAVKEYTIDEVIIAIDKISYERLYEISDICLKEKVNVKVSSELFDVIPQKFFIEEYSSIPVIDISTKIDIKIFYIFKKITDIILTIIGLLILLPFLILISVLIKIESKGPILFAQKRVGKNGKIFKFYKFRSMTISEKDDIERENMMIDFIKNNKKQFVDSAKIINEKRLTKIGKFLRKYSLDELPQLFNVIKGEMSLVGPRPCLPYEYENFDEWHKRRNSVLPGCTGVWQVAGRGEVSFDDSVVLDLYYINNVSPWLDIQLMIKTIPVMISAKGK
jgi:undecaprenyl-phosphate galactose phosphotransferase